MSLRAKLLLIFAALGLAPMLVVVAAGYAGAAHAVEQSLRAELENSAAVFTRGVEGAARARADELVELSRSRAMRDYVREASARREPEEEAASGGGANLPDAVAEEFATFFRRGARGYKSLACLDADGRVLFRVEGKESGGARVEPVFQTRDFVSGSVRADERVWKAAQVVPLHSAAARAASTASAPITIPIFFEVEGETARRGALVAEVRLDSLFGGAGRATAATAHDASSDANGTPRDGGTKNDEESASQTRFVVALDRSGHVVHHTSSAHTHQTVEAAMPSFKSVAEKMKAGAGGTEFYEEHGGIGSGGDTWLAAYRPVGVEGAGFSVAVAGNYSSAVAGARRAAWLSLALALAAGLAACALLWVVAGRRARRIGRVAEGAAAIARGELEQRVEVGASGDETERLAESFNRMSGQLRLQIEREAETKQFESFMRLSAMLTHDLKNSITGLSMLVSNMERQFHREEFRADAIESLREATDKLRRIVARLSEPMKSLSGEYRVNAEFTDLVPVIMRVLARTAEPARPLYEIETRLPATLTAYVEPERVENVFENLVINALEAMGARGGKLTVEAGEAEAGGTTTGGMVFVSVADTGPGMSEDFLRLKLFRPFSTTKTKGIGLGLYTCREIVETHGGRLDVKSEVGAGTRFRVVLPSQPFSLRERFSSRERSR